MDKAFQYILSYNRYLLIWLLVVAVFILLPRSVDNVYWRSSETAILWIVSFILNIAAQLHVMKKYFMPKYRATEIFSVKEYVGMVCLYFFIFQYLPFMINRDITMEMIDCFLSVFY